MASLGKITLSLASGSQEATLALANINFDFSMIKIAAPAEYQGLGASLSNKRKRKAEDGPIHITARKLGVLFTDDLPNTPNLAQAYGLRVSMHSCYFLMVQRIRKSRRSSLTFYKHGLLGAKSLLMQGNTTNPCLVGMEPQSSSR